jgi:hypothetical protein
VPAGATQSIGAAALTTLTALGAASVNTVAAAEAANMPMPRKTIVCPILLKLSRRRL